MKGRRARSLRLRMASRRRPFSVELLAVEFHLTVSSGQSALEALQLQQFQFPPVHGLNFRLAHVLLQ